MKKIGFLALIAVFTIGTVFAQNQENRKRVSPELITVEGTLQLQNGMIAVLAGETVYYVPRLQRYIGFIEGLKEGNSVSIEGYAYRNFLGPTKVTINGKSYDFPKIGFGQGALPGFDQMHRHGFNQGHGNWPRPMFGQGRGRMPQQMRNGPRQRMMPVRPREQRTPNKDK